MLLANHFDYRLYRQLHSTLHVYIAFSNLKNTATIPVSFATLDFSFLEKDACCGWKPYVQISLESSVCCTLKNCSYSKRPCLTFSALSTRVLHTSIFEHRLQTESVSMFAGSLSNLSDFHFYMLLAQVFFQPYSTYLFFLCIQYHGEVLHWTMDRPHLRSRIWENLTKKRTASNRNNQPTN